MTAKIKKGVPFRRACGGKIVGLGGRIREKKEGEGEEGMYNYLPTWVGK